MNGRGDGGGASDMPLGLGVGRRAGEGEGVSGSGKEVKNVMRSLDGNDLQDNGEAGIVSEPRRRRGSFDQHDRSELTNPRHMASGENNNDEKLDSSGSRQIQRIFEEDKEQISKRFGVTNNHTSLHDSPMIEAPLHDKKIEKRICEWCDKDDCDVVLGRASQEEFREHRRQSVSAMTEFPDGKRQSLNAVIVREALDEDAGLQDHRTERRLPDSIDVRESANERLESMPPLVVRPLNLPFGISRSTSHSQPHSQVKTSLPTRSTSQKNGRPRTWHFHNTDAISWTKGGRRVMG